MVDLKRRLKVAVYESERKGPRKFQREKRVNLNNKISKPLFQLKARLTEGTLRIELRQNLIILFGILLKNDRNIFVCLDLK